MSWHDRSLPDTHTPAGAPMPSHDALALTAGGNLARIVLAGQDYTLRITRSGKLILTK